jgi:hypothetical protein
VPVLEKKYIQGILGYKEEKVRKQGLYKSAVYQEGLVLRANA